MGCWQAQEATSLHADGPLPEFERRLLERHLVDCDPCQRFAVSAHAFRRPPASRPHPGAAPACLTCPAEGYDVLSTERRRVGVVDHLRYRSRLDVPDAIVVASGRLGWWRLRVIPLAATKADDPIKKTVLLRIPI